MSSNSNFFRISSVGKDRRKFAVPRVVLCSVLAVAGWTQFVVAAEPYGTLNDAAISNAALSNVSGIVGVNQAAGDFNLQANARAIAISGNGQATADIEQLSSLAGSTAADVSVTSIRDNAFQNTTGLISINQASGSGNLESNTILISPYIPQGELSDDLLSQASLDVASFSDKEERSSSDTLRTVNVDATAFRGVRGVLQLNQAAGMQNVTQNRVLMQTNN